MSSFKHDNKPSGPLLREHLGEPLSGARAPLAPTQAPGHAAMLPALEFSVRYTLSEYISFMWQHCGYLIRRRRVGLVNTYWLLIKSTFMAALHFVLQGRGRRTYEFTIDTHGIVRSCGTGVTLIPWRDVAGTRQYSCGTMLVLERGTLPLPARCLDAAQAAALGAYAAMVRAAARA